jgi:hypothetical protein
MENPAKQLIYSHICFYLTENIKRTPFTYFDFRLSTLILYPYIFFHPIMNSAPLPYNMSLTLPPVYSTHTVDGTRVPVYELIMGATPLSPLNFYYKTNRLTDKTRRYKSKMRPLSAPRGAIAQLFCPYSNGWPSYQLLRMLELVSLPDAIVSDIARPPYYLVQMATTSLRSK